MVRRGSWLRSIRKSSTLKNEPVYQGDRNGYRGAEKLALQNIAVGVEDFHVG